MQTRMHTHKLAAHSLIGTQTGIWFAEQLSQTQNEFNVAHYIEITMDSENGHFDSERLSLSIDDVLAKVDTLHSVYQASDEGAVQMFTPQPNLQGVLEYLDMSQADEPLVSALHWMREDLNQTIVLTSDRPRYRHCLIQIGNTEKPHWLWYQRYHHIDLDGYSFNAISDAIVDVYSAVDRKAMAPDFTAFIEVIKEYQTYENSISYQEDKAFWSDYTASLPEPISLVTGEGEVLPTGAIRLERRISSSFFKASSFGKSMAKLMDAEVAMASVFAYLYLVSDKQEVCLGFPFMRRLGSVALNATGPVVNVLPLTLSLDADMTLVQVTRAMNKALRQVRPRQRYEAQQIQRDLGRVGQALFGPILNYKPFMKTPNVEGVELINHLLSAGPIDDIEFSPSVREGGLTLEMSANADRYSYQSLTLHFARFSHMIDQIEQTPDITLAELSLLPNDEHDLIQAWAKGPSVAQKETKSSVLDSLSYFAKHASHKTALVYKDQTWDFAELRHSVDNRALKLKQFGINKGDVVGVALTRSPQTIIAMLAIFRAGAVYLPIDLAYPAVRINSILAQAKPELVLVEGESNLMLSGVKRSLNLAQWDAIETSITSEELPHLAPSDLAYILFTSGSTGNPKGVMNSQGALLNLMRSHQQSIFAQTLNTLAKSENTDIKTVSLNAAHVTSFTFDASFEQILWMLSGQTLFLYDEEERRDAQALVDLVQKDKIHALDLPPSLLNQMLDKGLMTGRHQPCLIMIGSEAVPAKLWSRLAAYPHLLVQNFYGPTEFTVDAISASVKDDVIPVIGKPLLNTHAYVLNQDLNLCAIGVLGELYLHGAGMAKGYLNQAAMTAERFVANPFVPGELMYRTGDMVRWRDSGQLDFVGRSDAQVKVRGFRIELGEVEAAISRIEGINSTLVIAQKHGENNRLLAYCILEHSAKGQLNESQIQDRINNELPEYMQPSGLMLLDTWPLNINGKIDKQALPDIKVKRSNTSTAPKNEQEKILCHAVAEQLTLDQVGVEDDFFNLGGDSISAMGLGTLLRKQGYQLRPRDVFSARTMTKMASLMAKLDVKTAVPQEGLIQPLPMWQWFTQTFDMQTCYVQGVLVSIEPHLSTEQVKQGVLGLITHNSVLRLAYQEGEYHILDKSHITQNIENYVAHQSMEDLEQQSLDSMFKAESQRLNLTNNALFKVIIMVDEKGNKALMILAHHFLVDGVSWRILLPQLKAHVLDQKAALSVEETGINSWSKALYEQVPSYRKEVAFWQGILQTKTHALTPRSPQTQLAHKRVLLSADVSQALLNDFSQETDVSVEEALLAAVSASLMDHSQRDVLKVNLESHGREDITDEINLSQTLGWFTTEYPVVIESGEEADMASLLKNVKQAVRCVPDKGLGFASLRYLDTDYQQAFATLEKANPSQVLFNYLGRFDARQGFWQAQQRDGVFADSFAVYLDAEQVLLHEFEVNIFVDDSGEMLQLAIHWSWDQAQHSQDQIIELTHGIETCLAQMIQWSQSMPMSMTRVEFQSIADQTRVAADLTEKGLSNTQLTQLENSYGPVRDVLPALPLQEGLLFHAQLGGAASHYNSTTRLSIDGLVDMSAIQMALNAVIIRHPQLLAHFDSHLLGRALQILPKKMSEWPLTQQDFSTLNTLEQEAALVDFEQQELIHEFDLSDANQPLLSATLIKLGDARYSLFVSAHHLVVDGWSTPILLRDFLLTYAGSSHELSPIKVDYPRVVAQLNQRDKQQAISLWQTVLEGCQPSIAFEEVPVQHQVNELTVTLSQEKTQALNTLLREFGLTLNTLMQGIWASVLGTMTGREDVVFGTPISGRFGAIEGIDEPIGLFSNTIPVRVALTAKSSLLSQLGDLQERQIQLLENDVLGLAEIQRLAGSDTLFDTLLVVENYPDNSDWYAKDYQGAKLTHIHNRGYTHYPLTLLVLPSDELHILIEYRDTVGIAQQVAQRLEKILDDIIIAPNKPLAQWDLRLEHEVVVNQQVNQTEHVLEANDLSTLMMRQAQKTPNALALQDQHCRYRYQDMRAQVLGIVALLQTYQISEGDIVAVALPRSATLSLAFNSILELGAAYLPLDVAYPDDRLAYMVDDAKPKLIITMGDYQHRFAALGELILFDQLPEPITETATLIQARRSLNPESGAYIIYTSGSTGKPKGVLVSHKAIVNRLHWMQSEYPLNTKDVILQKTPCSFDVSVWEFFWPLIEGASVMMAPPESHKDPEALLRIIEDYQVTTLHFVPSMLAAFMASISVRFKQGDQVAPSLKRVFCSGEALSKALSLHYGQYLNAPLHNLYGPTEAAVDVSYCQAYGDALHESLGSSVPIGLPVWNTQLYVLDSFLREVPIGVPGELYLAGEQLAIGYLNRAGLTADRFIANPFKDGQRMYRTGDVVRWLASGKVEYLGRSDDQLKIRGQRIELGEIETALAALDGVKQALVCAKTLNENDNSLTGADSRQLVAYVIPQADIVLEPNQLRRELSEKLPAHMVPVVVMVLSDFPLSENGKLDRNALPLPHALSNPQGREPNLGLETELAKLFSKVLGCDEVNAEDDFFALGGHSLLAMQLTAEIRQNLDIPVSVGQIMVSPSVEKLAQLFTDKDAFNDPSHAGLGGILPIRSGKGVGLFCINSASGFAWQYTGLIKHLKGQYPVHGLQSPRFDGAMADALDMADAASIYLHTLKAIQPQGPYHLLGYSFGGNIAHALAVALQDAGEDVAFLGLLDTYPPEGQDWDGPMNEQEQEEIEREKALFLNANNIEDDELSEERLTMFNDIEANYADSVRLLSSAKTGHFKGEATLFIAQQTLPQDYDVDTHWLPYLNGLQKHHLDASHEDMISPENVGDVGIKLKAMLDALGTLTD